MSTENAHKPKKLQGKTFFLTIPKCPEFTKEILLQKLLSSEANLEEYLISEEHHKDENATPHFHLYLRYPVRRNFSYSHFDYLGKHGNLQRVRSSDDVINYVIKEDPKPLTNINFKNKNLENHFQRTILEMVQKGFTVSALHNLYGLSFAHKPWLYVERLARRYLQSLKYAAIQKLYDTPLRVISREIIESELTTQELNLFDSFEGYNQLINIINKIITKRYQQDHKDCCVSIVSQPNMGKTYLFRKLAQFIPIYNYPEDGWHRNYDNNLYSAIFWNEWKLNIHDYQDYLRLFEGDPIDLKVKGSKANKHDRPFIILTSNKTYSDMVKARWKSDPDHVSIFISALKVRITEINFGEKPIGFLSKLFLT